MIPQALVTTNQVVGIESGPGHARHHQPLAERKER